MGAGQSDYRIRSRPSCSRTKRILADFCAETPKIGAIGVVLAEVWVVFHWRLVGQ